MPLFSDEIRVLESPIDVMYLMHKAFMIHSERTEALADKAQDGGDITNLKNALDAWIAQLLYHAKIEDAHMTGPLKDTLFQDGRMPLRDNVEEHDELRLQGSALMDQFQQGGKSALRKQVASVILDMEDKDHAELMGKVEEVETVIGQAIGEKKVLARTRRHLYESVVSFKVTEFDHFENEEAFVLPLVKDQMSDSEELECVRKLLFDDESVEPRWIIDFVAGELEGNERALLNELEKQIQNQSK
ncbi:MAG: hemerythrin domain-containing protein [Dehalococcoidia bacterium]|jgi:hypothetical protein|nr:hemerythrin domain-containing protein [Dehalococcoidia bacterium]